MKNIHIYKKIINNGLEFKVNNKTFQLIYSRPIWEKFLKTLHKTFTDAAIYVFT